MYNFVFDIAMLNKINNNYIYTHLAYEKDYYSF